MSYPCLQVGLLHQLVRRAHKFLTDERKVKEKCFFFYLPQYLRIPEGWVSPLLLGYFVSISAHSGTRPQCLLSRRVRSALCVRLSSIHTFQSPGSESISFHWSSHKKKKKKSSHTEPPTVSGLVQSLFGSNSLYPPHPQPPRPKIHPPRVSFEGGGAAIFFF